MPLIKKVHKPLTKPATLPISPGPQPTQTLPMANVDTANVDTRKEFFRPMVEELDVLPGFAVPVEAKRGPNWKETRSLGKISI